MGFRLGTPLGTLLCVLALAACGSSATTSSSASTSSAGASSTTSAKTSAGASSATSSTTAAPSNGSAGQLGYEGVPLEAGPSLAPASTTWTGRVDGIQCAPVEQLAYHIHAHLAVFVGGRLDALPAGIGIPGSVAQATSQGPVAAGGRCIYWLHTHTSDGVIHIESPTQRIYTLGDFFDEWHQPVTATRVAGVHGSVTAFLNGKLWKQSLRAIPLLPHALIQLNIGEPAAPLMSVNWSQTGL
jgi:hypothetical protein